MFKNYRLNWKLNVHYNVQFFFVFISPFMLVLLFFSIVFLHTLSIHTTPKLSTLLKKGFTNWCFHRNFTRYIRTIFLKCSWGTFYTCDHQIWDPHKSALTLEQHYSTHGVSIFSFNLIRNRYYACFGRVINHQIYNVP